MGVGRAWARGHASASRIAPGPSGNTERSPIAIGVSGARPSSGTLPSVYGHATKCGGATARHTPIGRDMARDAAQHAVWGGKT